MSGRIVFLHGLGSSPRQWDRVAATHGLDAVAPRLPWSWEAARRWGRTAQDDVETVMSCVSPGDVVVAHSFAATLVLLALSRDPGLAPSRVVLVSPFYLGANEPLQWAETRRLFDDFEVILAEGLLVSADRSLAPPRLAAMARAARDAIGPAGWARFMGAYIETAWIDPASVARPLTMIHGGNDNAALPAGTTRLSRDVPGSYAFMLADAGHFPMLETPAAFDDALQMAIAGHVPRRTGPIPIAS